MGEKRKMSFEAGLLTILIKMHVIAGADALAIEQSFHDSDVDQFDEYLLSEGIVDEENLLQALSEYYQVPAFDVVGYFFERHYVCMFPKDMLLRNEIIPLEVDENIMVMVAARPDNPELLSEIGEFVSYDIQFYVGIGRDICDAVKEFYDKADTEDDTDEDRNEENILMGEFHLLEESGEENIVFTVEDEDKFE
jgi:hypothetical protein